MPEHERFDQLRRLIDEISELAQPHDLSRVVHEATGVLLPGFMALPAVTILANDQWKTRANVEPDHWETGDLITLSAIEDDQMTSHGALFTPVGETAIPLVDVSRQDDPNPLNASFQLRPKDLWEEFEMQFALLPRDAVRYAAGWDSETICNVVGQLDPHMRELAVQLEVDGVSIRLEPQWGMIASPLRPVIESLRFPINHSWELLSPLIFRLRISPKTIAASHGLRFERQPAKLTFSLSESALRQIYRNVGIATGGQLGIAVYANALPLTNVDLKAWPVGDAFGDFVRATGMQPLGVAGVYPYKQAGAIGEIASLNSRANVFSLKIDPSGGVLIDYGLPGASDAARANQLLLWMTLGPRINGVRYRYEPTGVQQPFTRESQIFEKSFTVLPCFGGADCFPTDEKDLYANLMLNVSSAPQMLAHKDGISFAARDLLQRLGYSNIAVGGPYIELRIIEGARRRTVVLYLVNRSGRRMDDRHLRAMQSFMRDRAPAGTPIVIEEVF